MGDLGTLGGDASHGSPVAGFGGAEKGGQDGVSLLDQARQQLGESPEGSYTVKRVIRVDFTRDTSVASGTQAVTGVGFKPVSIQFIMANGSGADNAASIGFTTPAGSAKCLNTPDTGDTAGVWQTNSNVILYVESNTARYGATLESYDLDGFTLQWNKTGLPTATIDCSALCMAAG